MKVKMICRANFSEPQLLYLFLRVLNRFFVDFQQNEILKIFALFGIENLIAEVINEGCFEYNFKGEKKVG